MSALSADRFPEFFAALWGYDPFPWQARLAHQVCSGGWPAGCLDLPTGSGKTAVLEIAVFALAVSASGKCTAPRRIVLVVDRRVIVDQAHERARLIASRLNDDHASGVLAEVRDALLSLQGAGAERALATSVLRGGMLQDHAWTRSPVQPLLISSTVDQVGSRLLFRGYGVSSSMRPVHAGLLGSDTVFLLDEVHLSEPFAESLQTLASYARSPLFAQQVGKPLTLVRMSATPSESGPAGAGFTLEDSDRTHPVLSTRLIASKVATLCKVSVKGDESARRAQVATRVAALARDMVREGSRRVGVVVNRVDIARRVYAQLGEDSGLDSILLTGRMRPLDRDEVFSEDVRSRIVAGRLSQEERSSHHPIVVVATQTIEAGADFDFDGLVTECASLDALRQRFGRLNRLGSPERTAATVFVRADQVRASSDPDPIYRTSLRATWQWLEGAIKEHGHVDFGIEALAAQLKGVLLSPMIGRKEQAPPLLPVHLDHFAQTQPAPKWAGRERVEPGVWLHGPNTAPADVAVVWRADLTAEDLDFATAGSAAMEGVVEKLAACPPSSVEAVALPVWALKDWLARIAGAKGASDDFGDVEGGASPEARAESAGREGLLLVEWRGHESRVVSSAGEITPGATYVVPAEYGGIGPRSRNWDPESHDSVLDRGDQAQLVQRGVACARLEPSLLRSVWCSEVPAGWSDSLRNDQLGPVNLRRLLREWAADRLGAANLAPWQVQVLNALMAGGGRRRASVQLHSTIRAQGQEERTDVWIAAGRRLSRDALATLQGTSESLTPVSTEEDYSSFVGHEVLLDDHLEGVGQRAERYARANGLRVDLVADLALAGELHDLGKADPRFQLMLHGGDEIAWACASGPLAKSATPAWDRTTRRLARSRSGYPPGTRHELMSLALIEGVEELREQANDWPLVLHLVASHHGHCRPFAPAVVDSDPVDVSVEHGELRLHAGSGHRLAALDSGVSERFWQLVREYGWHGLAYLETILRLADHRQSEHEESREIEPAEVGQRGAD